MGPKPVIVLTSNHDQPVFHRSPYDVLTPSTIVLQDRTRFDFAGIVVLGTPHQAVLNSMEATVILTDLVHGQIA